MVTLLLDYVVSCTAFEMEIVIKDFLYITFHV